MEKQERLGTTGSVGLHDGFCLRLSLVTVRSQGTQVGPYVLRERVAVGGMSEIFLADAPEGRTVVVKVLGERLAGDTSARELLRNEATLGRALSHPNLVTVLDNGDQSDEPYLVMEYIDGVDLWHLQRSLQQTQRRMEAPLACHVVREILSAMAHVHAHHDAEGHGLIHRDVSPSNVLVSRTGDVKLGDLGIASPYRTPAGPTARGKVGYMAAEQLLGQSIDHRVDLFASGVVLAEVLIGRTLFTQGSDPLPLLANRDAQIEALADVLGDHPRSLVSTVLRALSRSPAERFQSAEEFRTALEPHTNEPAEARLLLSALVSWSRSSTGGRSPSPPASDESTTALVKKTRSPTGPVVIYESPPDPERTAEVPLQMYEVRGADGAVRGRYTYARLLDVAFGGGITPDDRVSVQGSEPRRADEVPELKIHLAERTATTSEVASAAADWADVLPGCTFLHALGRLVFGDESGMLVAEATPARKEVFVSHGRPTHLVSNLAGEMVGEFLVAQSVITRGELDMALAVTPRFQGRLEQALVQLGLVNDVDLAALTDKLARDKLMDLFRWRRGTVRFFKGLTPPAGTVTLTVDPYTVLREGAMLLDDPEDHFSTLLDRRVIASATPRALGRLGLTPIDHGIISGADGRSTVRTLVHRIALDRRTSPRDVFRALYLLTELSAVELHTT